MNKISYISEAKNQKTAFYRTLGFNLWLCRKRKRLSLTRAAENLDIPAEDIDRIERGKIIGWRPISKLLKYYNKKIGIILIEQ